MEKTKRTLSIFLRAPHHFHNILKEAISRTMKELNPAPEKKAPAKPQNPLCGASFNFTRVNFFVQTSIILHTGEGRPGQSHLNLWIPHFAAAQIPYIILIRNADLYKWAVQKYPSLSIAYAKKPLDVEKLINRLPQLQAVLYPSNTGNNIHLLRFNDIEHIFIGHGDSDKTASAHKFFRVYDKIWVAGQAHIDRFANAPFESKHISFLKVGRPNLKAILKNNTRTGISNSPSVLYLPTWEGVYEEQNYSSINFAGKLLSELHTIFGATINAKLHPQTGIRDKTLANAREHLKQALTQQGILSTIHEKSTGIEELVPLGNIFICDISAVVTECLSANKPIFVYKPKDREIKMSQCAMPYEYYAYTFNSFDELIQKLTSVLDGEDPLAENRKKAIDYFVSEKETLNDGFLQQLKQIDTSSKHNSNCI